MSNFAELPLFPSIEFLPTTRARFSNTFAELLPVFSGESDCPAEYEKSRAHGDRTGVACCGLERDWNRPRESRRPVENLLMAGGGGAVSLCPLARSPQGGVQGIPDIERCAALETDRGEHETATPSREILGRSSRSRGRVRWTPSRDFAAALALEGLLGRVSPSAKPFFWAGVSSKKFGSEWLSLERNFNPLRISTRAPPVPGLTTADKRQHKPRWSSVSNIPIHSACLRRPTYSPL